MYIYIHTYIHTYDAGRDVRWYVSPQGQGIRQPAHKLRAAVWNPGERSWWHRLCACWKLVFCLVANGVLNTQWLRWLFDHKLNYFRGKVPVRSCERTLEAINMDPMRQHECVYTCMRIRLLMCVCVYACTCVCVYIYIYIYIHTYVHTYIHTYIHTHIRTYIHTCIHTHIRTYTYTYIHMYIFMYVCIIHSYIFKRNVTS